MEKNGYYISRKKKLMKELRGFTKILRPELISRYGQEKSSQSIRETMEEFEKLIPRLPYIGGKANHLTINLIQAVFALAFYRVMKNQGKTVEETGELIHLGIQAKLNKIPAFIRRFMGKRFYSEKHIRKLKKSAEISQLRRYPGDWVFEITEGDGKSFDVAMIYTECGIDKLLRSLGTEELTPYLCNTDYVIFRSLGMELMRTQTLGWGCPCCDFHIKRRGSMPPAWPPQFVERTCGQHVDEQSENPN